MKARALGVAFVLAIAAAATADLVAPAEPGRPAGITLEQRGGTLVCPYGVHVRGTAYLDLLNTGDEATVARVSILPDRGKRWVEDVALPPGRPTGVKLHGRVRGAGMVLIESSGGPVVASHSAWLTAGPGRRQGGVGGSCLRAEPAQLVVARMSTVRTESFLAVANPGGAPADVSITLYADGRRLRPETLTRRVVPARSRRIFRLGDFAFDAGDLTAVVEARAGRVVAEALVESSAGVYVFGARPAAIESTLIAGLVGRVGSLSVVTIGDEDAGIDSRLLTTRGQGKAPNIPTALAPAASVRTQVAARSGSTASAYRFVVNVGSPVWSAAAWRRDAPGRSDVAAAEAMVPAVRWASVIGLRTRGAVARMILANPGDAAASVTLTIYTRSGAEERGLTVPAGRITLVTLGRGAGTYGVSVNSDVPIATLMEGAAPIGTFAFPGMPFLMPSPVAVRIRPRTGVPG